jgi:hypothetical protein
MPELTELETKLAEVLGLARANRVSELTEWLLPIQRRHFEQTREAVLRLAAAEDPDATSWGWCGADPLLRARS